MEIVPFGGWQRNARLVSGDTEMIVTLEVGPRIISYGFVGGENLMAVSEKSAGKTGGDEFRSYGGHRLWIAPEEDPRTFQPDNSEVEYTMDGEWHVFASATDKFHIRKEMRIKPEAQHSRFKLIHRIYNQGAYSAELGPWTPTQFLPDGECLFPQASHIPHSEKVLPARPLVLWHYTDMTDPRWTWGRRVVRLRGADAPPTKCGALVEQGYAAYAREGALHLRRFRHESGQQYPDFGCNFETFTRHDILEVETMGPMQTVAPGEFAEHPETWYLLKDQAPPAEDEACASWLESLARDRPL
jgi:hypothetical protein